MKKPVLHNETAYFAGVILLALATALMTTADFGLSMVVAPAYLLHLKLSQIWSFVSFGVAEYIFQAVLLTAMCIVVRRFKLAYLFSFVTTLFYGAALDLFLLIVQAIPGAHSMAVRIVMYVVGIPLCSLSVALLFRTYISPGAYELFVKEVSVKFGLNIDRTKLTYDCISCALGVVMSFAFFGFMHFEGIKLGTIVCALVNGPIIGAMTKMLDRTFEAKDAWKLRKYFE